MSATGALTTLAHFAGTNGGVPIGGLIEGSDGAFYGTTTTDNIAGRGTIYRITSDGALTTLAVIGRTPLSSATGALTAEDSGALLGTTQAGGSRGFGSIYRLGGSGSGATLAEFTGAEGSIPNRGLVRTADGAFYGTARTGGKYGLGTVFRLSAEGVLSVVVSFAGPDGATPAERLTLAADGSLLGTTEAGGVFGKGSVFRVLPPTKPGMAGVLITLWSFSFTFSEGVGPFGGLAMGGDGAYYGTTRSGGTYGDGTIFRFTTAGFVEIVASLNGAKPVGGLILGLDGKLYGLRTTGVYRIATNGTIETVAATTALPAGALVRDPSGAYYGIAGSTVFRVTTAGTLTTAQDFSNDTSAGTPMGELAFGADGNLYGATTEQIYRLIFPGAATVENSGAAQISATTAQLTGKLNARGAVTTARYEYGTDGVSFPSTRTVLSSPFAGYLTATANANLTGLVAGTTYYFRMVAANSSGTSTSAVQSFTTLSPPTVAALPATAITPTGATLSGFVNGHGKTASVYIEYGTDGINFPSNVVPTPSSTLGTGNTLVTASASSLSPGATYFYRLVASSEVGTTAGAPISFETLNSPLATVGPAFALTTTSARVTGSVRARKSTTTMFFDYGTDGVTFPNTVAAIPATVTGDLPVAVSADLVNLAQGVTYFYRVRAESAGGTGASTAAELKLAVLSGFAHVAPGAPPPAQGFVFVTLSPDGIGGGWRFAGEQVWRASDVPVGGLATGDREIEFRPVPGYLQPSRETVSVISGGAATVLESEYYELLSGAAGGVNVTLKPSSLAEPTLPTAQRAQWRFLGDTQWRESGTTAAGFVPGIYLLEFKPLNGRTTPAPISVSIEESTTRPVVATYFVADAPSGTPPSVLSFDTVSTSPALPYAFTGQLRSDAGSATGFVVKPHVVATAAHFVFDDGALTYATGLQWLFQRDRGTYEPKPQIPRGFYVFDGYAAQRTLEATPGQSSPQSQNVDAAALYFVAKTGPGGEIVEDGFAGRGGSGGYLASDSTSNEWLLSTRLKLLTGYPVDGIPAANQGRMHATPPANVTFTPAFGRTYTTTAITSTGGNSGGPLYVQFDDGNYYPAAIYLGGSAQTVVRAIDSGVIDLFTRAETSANGGGNNTGGGITQVNAGTGGAAFSPAGIEVKFLPAAAVSGGARWTISPSTTLHTDNAAPIYRDSGGNVTVNFNAVPGFLTPPSEQVTLVKGVLSTITRTYYGITSQPQDRSVAAFSNVTFSVAYSGAPTGFRWRRNGVNIAGATAASYTLTGATASSIGNYTCIVTWQEGSGSVSQTSSVGTLTVNPVGQTLSFNLLPNKTFGDQAFDLTAAASSGQPVSFTILSGPATLIGNTVTLTGLGSVTVRADQSGDANYAAASPVDRLFEVLGETLSSWNTHRFTASELSSQNISGPEADPDRDGLSNMLEFAFNLDPKSGDSAIISNTRGLPSVHWEEVAGARKLTVEFVRRKSSSFPGISYTPQFSSDLAAPASWIPATAETVTSIDDIWERVKASDPAPVSANRFSRVFVSGP